MQYCKYIHCSEGYKEETYLEVDQDCVLRQISKINNEFISSNRKNYKYDFWLTEGEFSVDKVDSITIISKEEFEVIWNRNNEAYSELWKGIKNRYKINDNVDGYIEVFYPQGVIISVDEVTLGIANYNECREGTMLENLYPNHLVDARVIGYDEVNMWLILDNPKVHKEEFNEL